METLLCKVALLAGERRAMESISRNAHRYVDELRARHPQLRDEDVARLAVHRVIAEAHAHPPAVALRVLIGGRSSSDPGVWTETGLAITLEWCNRADFSIQVEDIRGALSIIERTGEETFTLGANTRFEVPARSEYRLTLVALRDGKGALPACAERSVSGEAYVEALVAGPWPEASHQVCRFNAARTWFPIRQDPGAW